MSFPPDAPKARWLEREDITAVLRELEPRTRMTARLQMLHCTGMRLKQLGMLTADNFRLDDDIPHVIVPAAKVGRPAVIPLSADGIEAVRQFMGLNAYGPVDTTRANMLLRKAAQQAGRPAFTTYQREDDRNLRARATQETAKAIERMSAASSSGSSVEA